jgi:hypothetical protein
LGDSASASSHLPRVPALECVRDGSRVFVAYF